jgi:hypothetical protein
MPSAVTPAKIGRLESHITEKLSAMTNPTNPTVSNVRGVCVKYRAHSKRASTSTTRNSRNTTRGRVIEGMDGVRPKSRLIASLRIIYPKTPTNHLAQRRTVMNIAIEAASRPHTPRSRWIGCVWLPLPTREAVLASTKKMNANVSKTHPARRKPDLICSPTVRLSLIFMSSNCNSLNRKVGRVNRAEASADAGEVVAALPFGGEEAQEALHGFVVGGIGG